MNVRKNKFIGCYISPQLRRAIDERIKAEGTNLSVVVETLLIDALGLDATYLDEHRHRPQQKCTGEGCTRDALARGMCVRHYRLLRARERSEAAVPPPSLPGEILPVESAL